jgi:hypothetical protein
MKNHRQNYSLVYSIFKIFDSKQEDRRFYLFLYIYRMFHDFRA